MNTSVAERQQSPIVELRVQLENMEGQFKAALPAHIPVERFARVLMTAIQNNPDLVMKVDRRSLFNAAMRSAQDGLLPDGRDGAIVVYGSTAQWMPMIGGLRKKVRNSGEIATWDAQIVHKNDKFQFRLGDDPFIQHEPVLESDPGPVIAAYSIAVLKTGEKSREVMSVHAIEKVRQRSKAKNNGPWITDYEEMCRKTVARRHSKVLPMSTDLDDLLRRDDELYDFDAARAENATGRPQTLAGKLDVLASLPAADAPSMGGDETQDTNANTSQSDTGGDAGAGSSTATGSDPDKSSGDPDSNNTAGSQQTPVSSDAGQPVSDKSDPPKVSDKKETGKASRTTGEAEQVVPTTEAQFIPYANGWRDELTSSAEGEKRWASEKVLRNKANVGGEVREDLKTKLDAKIAELKAAGK